MTSWVRSGAKIEGPYRYTLLRQISDARGRVLFIMLNPSTADAIQDDPTIRRCVGFARDWGFGQLEVCNLFAFRSTDPRALTAAADPVGPRNDAAIRRAVKRSDLVVTAWGAEGGRSRRAAEVSAMLAPKTAFCLGRTLAGAPRHPLYVARRTALVPFR